MARLAAEKCNGVRGLDRGAANLAAGAVDARGNIHGEDRPFGPPGPFIETQNNSLGRSIEIANKARAKQRVDRKTGRFEINVLDGVDIARPASGRARGVAPQTLARPKQSDFDGKFLARQQARGDKAIAAIVARPAKNRDAALARNKPGGLPCHRRTSLFHQHGTGRASRDGEPVGFRHFGVGQQLHGWTYCQHATKIDS